MIIGIGVDMAEIARIENTLARQGDAFLQRCFTGKECAEGNALTLPARRAAFFAKRFAAKEACAKALGCGIGQYLGFQDIEITRNEGERPVISVSDTAIAALHQAGRIGKTINLHLSLSDEKHYALAYVVAEEI